MYTKFQQDTYFNPSLSLSYYSVQVFKNLTTEMLSNDQHKEAYEVAMAMQSQLELAFTSDAARYLEEVKEFIAT